MQWSVHLSVSRGLGDDRQTVGYLGISRSFGGGRTAAASLHRQGGRDQLGASVTQSMTPEDRRSWRLQASAGDGDPMLQAEATREWSSLRGQANLFAQGESLSAWVSGQAAIAWMDGRWMTSRTIPDAFALVSTDGIGGVPVQLENRAVGTTDRDGYLLVAPLYGWMSNRLSIDALSLPADLAIATSRQDIVVRGLAGTRVHFPMRRVRSALVVLVDARGAALPAGTPLKVVGTGASAEVALTVGYDGEVWIEDLAATGNRIERAEPGQPVCQVTFDFPANQASPARLGPLACTTTLGAGR